MSLTQSLMSFGKRHVLPARIRWALRRIEHPIIVEVGANDGKKGDPLYGLIMSRKSRTALLVEPVPYLFEQLRLTYAGEAGCTCVNVAISATEGTADIHFISPDARHQVANLPEYFEELASFDRERLVHLLPPDQHALLVRLSVPTLPLRVLLQQHAITHVDILQIDTEGFDFEVLKTFPFESMQPSIVCFEHCHLTSDTKNEARQMLSRLGYRIESWGKDYVCTRRPTFQDRHQ